MGFILLIQSLTKWFLHNHLTRLLLVNLANIRVSHTEDGVIPGYKQIGVAGVLNTFYMAPEMNGMTTNGDGSLNKLWFIYLWIETNMSRLLTALVKDASRACQLFLDSCIWLKNWVWFGSKLRFSVSSFAFVGVLFWSLGKQTFCLCKRMIIHHFFRRTKS